LAPGKKEKTKTKKNKMDDLKKSLYMPQKPLLLLLLSEKEEDAKK
jgi:hypothetical protein